LYVFPTSNIVNVLINFTFLTATYFSKAQFSLFVLKVPSNPNQSIKINCDVESCIFVCPRYSEQSTMVVISRNILNCWL